MKVILTEGHENLGEAGSVIVVKDGFARNYLIPPETGPRCQQGKPERLQRTQAPEGGPEHPLAA